MNTTPSDPVRPDELSPAVLPKGHTVRPNRRARLRSRPNVGGRSNIRKLSGNDGSPSLGAEWWMGEQHPGTHSAAGDSLGKSEPTLYMIHGRKGVAHRLCHQTSSSWTSQTAGQRFITVMTRSRLERTTSYIGIEIWFGSSWEVVAGNTG